VKALTSTGGDTRVAIDVRGVRHTFNDPRTGRPVKAIERVDLQVQAGAFVSIVGPSGCGKTTLLNIIAGLIPSAEGDVSINGQPVMGLQPAVIGYMFARDTLLPWRTVVRNVEFGLEFRKCAERRKTAERFLSLVGLSGFEDSYPDQLSHGMRQRVALARTLAPDPEILLMDEPFGALDAQTKLLVEEEFLRIWEGNQKTVVFVTHDLGEALTLSDRVIVFAARPGYIKEEYLIHFPRPRVADELHFDDEFQRLYREIWHQLKSENIRVDSK
jgi:NitT/TauT family transport system ATP-binding protein